MIQKKSDDAISPVIGVMLMLVVTVVIAAAVTIFATGVVGETEPAPVAVLDVQILNQGQMLRDCVGPELFITHISGDPVDTADIEIRSSWTHKDANGNDCTHYSSYSAEGCKKELPDGIGMPSGTPKQALFVKGNLGGNGLTNYFGEVTLTPGLKLCAFSEALVRNAYNPESPTMDVIFNNYQVMTKTYQGKYTEKHNVAPTHIGEYRTYNPNCSECVNNPSNKKDKAGNYYCIGAYRYQSSDPNGQKYIPPDYCGKCGRPASAPGDGHKGCADENYDGSWNTITTSGIMQHLQPGTAVDIMIVHIPSGKAIYDKTVIVQ